MITLDSGNFSDFKAACADASVRRRIHNS